VWGLFTFIYLVIPNTRVRFSSGLLGGIIAGTIFLLVQWAYVNFQIGVAKYNPIYGSLAALPLLLIWLNLGWIILLIGAEYSFAHQNVETYEFEPDYASISLHFKRLLTLRILHLLAKRFAASDPPLSASQISQTLMIPSRHVQDILAQLVECGLVSNMQSDRYEETSFQPASDINLWTVKYVTDVMERSGVNHIPVAQTQELQNIEETLQKIDAVIESSADNKLLRDI
jgi:membrane protein